MKTQADENILNVNSSFIGALQNFKVFTFIFSDFYQQFPVEPLNQQPSKENFPTVRLWKK